MKVCFYWKHIKSMRAVDQCGCFDSQPNVRISSSWPDWLNLLILPMCCLTLWVTFESFVYIYKLQTRNCWENVTRDVASSEGLYCRWWLGSVGGSAPCDGPWVSQSTRSGQTWRVSSLTNMTQHLAITIVITIVSHIKGHKCPSDQIYSKYIYPSSLNNENWNKIW